MQHVALLFVLFVWSSSPAGGSAFGPPSAKPNIVMMFADDLGYGDLGFTGHPTTHTPNLNKMAWSGKRLSGWYSAYPVCSSSRAALMTGRPGVLNSLSIAGLPLNETIIPQHLKSVGYKTLAIGKWHLGQQPLYLPLARGFDRFLGLPFSVDDGVGFASECPAAGAAGWARPPPPPPSAAASGGKAGVALGPSLPLPLIHQSTGSSRIVQQPADLVPLSTKFKSEIENFTRSYAPANPLFLYIAFPHVHTTTSNIMGLQYSGCDYVNSTRRGLFGDALAELDSVAGSIWDLFHELELQNNTLFIFTSDNGPSLRWGKAAGSMGIFTGRAAGYPDTGKGSTWEGGIRMPAFAVWPGKIAPATVSSEVISTMDVLPTLLTVAGVPIPSAAVLDGVEMTDILFDKNGAASKHTFLPFYNEPQIANASSRIFAARFGQYKVHFITSPGLGGGIYPNVLRPPNETAWGDNPLFFDIDADPSEAYPLFSSSHSQVKGLAKQVLQLKSEYEAKLVPRAINPAFGFQYALCCGVGCTEPCNKCTCENAPLPLS